MRDTLKYKDTENSVFKKMEKDKPCKTNRKKIQCGYQAKVRYITRDKAGHFIYQ